MPVIECPGCGRRSSVAEKFIGQQLQCRHCKAKFTAELPAAATDALVEKPSMPMVKTSPHQLQAQGSAPLVVPGEERKPCPFCGELIPREAKLCRFCNQALDPVLRAAQEDRSQTAAAPPPPMQINVSSAASAAAVAGNGGRRANGFATASLVFGIVSVFACWLPFIGLLFGGLGLLTGVVGLLLSFGRDGVGLASSILGGVLSLVGTVLGIAFLVGILSAGSRQTPSKTVPISATISTDGDVRQHLWK